MRRLRFPHEQTSSIYIDRRLPRLLGWGRGCLVLGTGGIAENVEIQIPARIGGLGRNLCHPRFLISLMCRIGSVYWLGFSRSQVRGPLDCLQQFVTCDTFLVPRGSQGIGARRRVFAISRFTSVPYKKSTIIGISLALISTCSHAVVPGSRDVVVLGAVLH